MFAARMIVASIMAFLLASCIYIVNDSPGDRAIVRSSPPVTVSSGCSRFVAPEMDPEPLVPDITNETYKDRKQVEELLANHIQAVRQWGLNYQAKVKEAANNHQIACR